MSQPTARPATFGTSVGLLLAGVGGGVILGARPRRDSMARPLAILAGMALLGYAAHRPLADGLRRAGTRRRGERLRFSFTVERPVEQVFAFCADFENFPRFIGALREVRDTGDGRSHWCASTPTGGEIEWDAVTTKFVTNSVMRWRSIAGSPVEMNALVRFSPESGATCLRVEIDYRVLEGSMADAIAALTSPRREKDVEADIRRFEAHLLGTADRGAAGDVAQPA